MKRLADILLLYPVKTTFSLLIAIIVILVTLLSFIIDLRFSFESMKKEKVREVKVLSDNLYQLSDYFINIGDYETLQKIIVMFSVYSNVEVTQLIDRDGKVMISSRRKDIGNIAERYVKEGCYEKSIFKISCSYSLSNGKIIDIDYNLSKSFKNLAFYLSLKYLSLSVISISSLLLINFLFFKFFAEKIEKISNFLKEAESGQLTQPLQIEGKNELSYIANKINKAYTKLWEMANFDRLTNIPNRFFLEVEFNKHIPHNDKIIFIALIDMDNFKELNDFFGHNFGDMVLINFATKLKEKADKYDYVCGRLGGDEFVVFGCEYNLADIINNVESIFKSVSGDYQIRDTYFRLTISMGVSIKNKFEDIDFYDLLKEADIALYKAKEKGKNKIHILSQEEKEEEYRKKKLYSELSLVTENKELFMMYQPILDGYTGEIVGYESLVRWNSKKFGLVSPGDFIPYLEATGQIITVGKYITEEVVKAVSIIGKPIHLNVSSKQLFDKDFADYVENLLKKNRLSPHLLIVEITETQEIPKDKVVTENLTKLKEFGIRVSLDDFGTGYSNLYTISQLNPDSIKIDIYLIKDLDKDKNKLRIVKAIKEMADELGIKVIAEGVERQEIKDILLSIDIRYMQGYYFGKPERLESIRN